MNKYVFTYNVIELPKDAEAQDFAQATESRKLKDV